MHQAPGPALPRLQQARDDQQHRLAHERQERPPAGADQAQRAPEEGVDRDRAEELPGRMPAVPAALVAVGCSSPGLGPVSTAQSTAAATSRPISPAAPPSSSSPLTALQYRH